MKKRSLIYTIIRCVMIIVSLQCASFAFTDLFPSKKKPVATQGIIDLRDWDFEQDGPVDLSGEWEFDWRQLTVTGGTGYGAERSCYVTVPGIWNGLVIGNEKLSGYGCATYRLKILLPRNYRERRGEKLALRTRDMGTAYALYIDGRCVGGGGIVGDSDVLSYPGYWPDVFDCPSAGEEIDVALMVSNFHHNMGGVWRSITMGTSPMLHDSREKKFAWDFFLFGAIFLMGVYHLVMFSLRKKEGSYCYFGIFCLLISVRILVTGEYYAVRLLPGAPWELVLKAEFLTFYAGMPAFFLFMRSLFPAEFSRKALKGIVAAGVLGCSFIVLTPARWYTHTMQGYQILTTLVCLYASYVIVRAVIRRREGSISFAAGFVIMFATVMNDFLHSNMLIRTEYLVPLGLLVFIFSQAFMLSFRFTQNVAAIERLTGELEHRNRGLLDLDRMKDDFLASVSHELKTPLHGIIGIAESMMEERLGKLSLESKYYLGLAVASGRRLDGLVNDLLDFARLKNSAIVVNRAPLDMHTLADVVLALTRPLAGTKKIEMINTIANGTPRVFADENRMQQVLYNLVGNALKFTDSGRIIVGAWTDAERGFMEISISDTGAGIPAESLTRIFNAYEQAGTEARDRGGAGIGLFIARTIVELHDGSIWAESAPGKGSVIRFTLPLWKGQDGPGPKMAPALPEAGGVTVSAESRISCPNGETGRYGRILVVDDDAVNLDVIRAQLSGEEYLVSTTACGTEAIDLAQTGNYDLALLDIMMPGMSGFELCRELRRRFSLFELPVVMLTARHGVSDLLAGFESGANDYLEKPINRQELLARVRTLVSLKRSVREHDRMRYKLLQERMNPHFLFNALNTVHALINRDRRAADRAVIMLADNYRFLIDHAFTDLVPFDMEWRFVENYLALEELRFKDTLSVYMLRQGDFSGIRVPPLTLQPLVENALKHGIRRCPDGGTVSVFAETDAGRLTVIVRDNGPGLDDSRDIFSRSLGNIRKRLNHYYNNVDMTVNNGEEGGVTARVSFRVDDCVLSESR